MTARVITGDCMDVLRTIPSESVHCVVTSPPYWGLRAYKGDPGMIGLEPTFDEHLANLVAVFREVRRVLRSDGTLWLNYGDAYASNGVCGGGGPGDGGAVRRGDTVKASGIVARARGSGFKPKDLMMMPARVAMALQADGWWLRSEIVWHKPNPMPESCRDRPTSAHEKMFLFAKSGAQKFWTHRTFPGTRERPEPDHRWVHRETKEEIAHDPSDKKTWQRINLWRGHGYFYDAEAVRHPSTKAGKVAGGTSRGEGEDDQRRRRGVSGEIPSHANLRNVWTIATHSFKEAHFATFPPALVGPCIKAGTSAKGVCGECGAPWVRVVNRELQELRPGPKQPSDALARNNGRGIGGTVTKAASSETTGWRPTCDHHAAVIPATCLDPFAGSGTVGLVADRLQRDAVLVEISEEYAVMARRRIVDDAPALLEGVK